MAAQGEKTVYASWPATGQILPIYRGLVVRRGAPDGRDWTHSASFGNDRHGDWESFECAGMIFAAATMSRTIAAAAAVWRRRRLRHSDRRRRPRHRHHHRARPDRLGARHRSERADRRRRDRQRRRHAIPAARSQPAAARNGAPNDQMGQFVAAVLGNTEDTWSEIFQKSGQQYRAPRLRLFSGVEQGGCGFAQAAMGPFYCPTDQRIYLDTSFFRDMQTRFRGCTGQGLRIRRGLCDRARGRPSRAEPARHSAEGAAGAAAPPAARRRRTASRCGSNCRPIASPASGPTTPSSARQFLEPGDVEAALQTAAAIGDDRCRSRRAARGAGRLHPRLVARSAAALVHAPGFKEGKVSACNTFAAAQL